MSGMPRDPLVFGSLWHWLMEMNYDLLRREGCLYELDGLLSEWFNAVGKHLGDQKKVEIFFSLAEALYDPYWEFWRDDTAREWVAVEGKFDVNFRGYRLRGMRDGMYLVKGRPWILETKTAAQIRENELLDTLEFNFQNLFYLLSAEIESGGRRAAGVLYNVVRKPGQRYSGTYHGQPEDLLGFRTRIMGEVRAKPHDYFKRFELTYSTNRRRVFAADLYRKLEQFADWLLGRLPTYKNEAACVGKWRCEFLSACSNMSMSGYTQNRALFEELGGI